MTMSNGNDADRTSVATTHSRASTHKEPNENVTISNYGEYQEFLMKYDDHKPLYIFYGGSDSPNSGYNWCHTCVQALPVIEKALSNISSSFFLIVQVGTEEEWQCKSNPYRLDKDLNLKVIPTILKFNSPKRLEGEYCMKPELLELLFEEDCES